MITAAHIAQLDTILNQHYDNWQGVETPAFVAEEIRYKQETIEKAQTLLSPEALAQLLKAGDYEEVIRRIETLGRDNNLLWNNVPTRGDLAILHAPHLPVWDFAEQFRRLLYDKKSSPRRLQAFANFCQAHNLPNKWAFATYFLFIVHPQTEIFVKPRAAKWLLQFVGQGNLYRPQTNAETYRFYRAVCHTLQEEFAARDMVEVQSLIWVVYRRHIAQQEDIAWLAHGEGHDERWDDDVPFRMSSERTALLQLAEETEPYKPIYTLTQLAEESGVAEAKWATWLTAVARKKQAIFYGSPGTGKTFIAQKLAQYLVGGSDGLIELVQFHPAYDYVDFIEGLRPTTDDSGQLTYQWQAGRLLAFCEQVRQRHGRSILIIDEINRANLAQVFGELLYLLEYRGATIRLASGANFQLPANLIILGTMNTADRAIALVDHALRRRFLFIPVPPNYDILRRFEFESDEAGGALLIEPFIGQLQVLNEEIGDPHYHIGHTYFLHPELATLLPTIWQLEIEPYLEELFFSQPAKLAVWRWDALKARLSTSGGEADAH